MKVKKDKERKGHFHRVDKVETKQLSVMQDHVLDSKPGKLY